MSSIGKSAREGSGAAVHGIADADAEAALSEILHSETLKGANRLKSFLAYIVHEEMAGRGAAIRAKRIAVDVYGRRLEKGADHEAVVRVDAGRLRRRLEAYYAEEGRAAQLRIVMTPGSYRPAFEQRQKPDGTAGTTTPGPPPRFGGRFALPVAATAVAGMVAAAVGLAILSTGGESGDDATTEARLEAERRAVFEASPASLQAMLMLEEAQGFIFPSLDPARPRAAVELCKRITELMPQWPESHACLSHAFGKLAFLSKYGPARAERLEGALAAAEQAVALDAANARAQSAYGWALFVEGRHEEGIAAMARAVQIDPEDLFARNFLGMALVFNGEAARLLSGGDLPGGIADPRTEYHPFIIAGADFFVGDFQKTIALIERAAVSSAHSSALMTALLTASYEQLDQREKAEPQAAALRRIWPDWDHEEVLLRYFSEETDARAIASPVSSVLRRLQTAERP